MRLYLSGPITGVDNYRKNFRNAAEGLRRDGYTDIINPAELCAVLPPEHTAWEEYMRICMELLDMAEAVILLPGWEQSRGAQREIGYAMAKGLIILEYSAMKGGGTDEKKTEL